MQKNAKSPLLVNSGVSQATKYLLSAIRIIGIVILGGYSGIWTHQLLNQKPQGYNERATQSGKQSLKKEARSENEHVKKVHNKETAKQKAEVLPVVIADPLTFAYNKYNVACELKTPNVSGIIACFMDSPYLTTVKGRQTHLKPIPYD